MLIEKNRMKYLFTCLICLCTLNAWSQDVWDLQKCVDYAIENNIQIKQSQLDLRTSEVNLNDSRMSSLPSLNGSASLQNSTGRSIDPFTNTIIDQGVNSQNFSLNASLPIFNGFQIMNAKKRDEYSVIASQQAYEDTKNNVTLNVVNFYLTILFNQELLEAARLRQATTEAQLNRVKKQVEIGALPKANELQIKQQLANDELEVVRAENNLAISKLQLKQALQLPADTPMEVAVPELEEPQEVVMESSEQVFQYAVQNQPVVKSAEAQEQSAMYGVKVAQSNYYPSLSFNAGLSTAYSSAAPEQLPKAGVDNVTVAVPIGYLDFNGTRYPVQSDQTIPEEFTDNTYFNQLDVNQRKFLSLNLNIPIFNKFQVRNNVQRAIINQERSEYQLTNTKNQLRQTIEQAYQDVVAAAKSYTATKNSVEAAEESFRNADQRSNLGAIDAVEYTQIKNDYETAKSNLIRSKFDYIFKQKVLDFYQGKPINL